jgi:hypothetical protein
VFDIIPQMLYLFTHVRSCRRIHQLRGRNLSNFYVFRDENEAKIYALEIFSSIFFSPFFNIRVGGVKSENLNRKKRVFRDMNAVAAV